MKSFIHVTVIALAAAIAMPADTMWAKPGGGGGGSGRSAGGGGARAGGGGSFRGGGGGGARIGGGGGARVGGGAPHVSGGSGVRAGSGQGSVRSGGSLSGGSFRSGNVGSPSGAPRVQIGSSPRGMSGVNRGAGPATIRSSSGSRSAGSLSAGPQVRGSTAGRLEGAARVRTSEGTPGSRAGGQTVGNARTRGDADARLPGRGELNARGGSAAGRQVTRASVNRPQVERVNDFLGLPGRTAGAANVRSSAAARASAHAQLVSHRPSWSTNVRAAQLTRVNNNLRHANLSPVHSNVSTRNWLSANPARAQHWNQWAGGIRHHWQPRSYQHCFTPRWWAVNNVYFPWRHNYYWWGARPWSYWWSGPSWNTCASWYSGWGWNTPYYYDYGYGGNVVFVDRYVYVNGQPVSTTAEYAQSAADLAATEPSPEIADQPGEWMALGTFAIATSKEETDPTRVIQLAVDKEGNVSGTMVNKTTNKTYPVQGRVDKETQRVAFTIGDNKDVVLETGLYNLTQQETPVLVHQGTDRTETYVMLRVEAPQEAEQAESGSPSSLLP